MKTLNRIFSATLFVVFSLAALNGWAIKADPRPSTIEQPDGSFITIRVHGDEFFNYTTTADGYIIAQKEDGFYYYADYNSGSLKISDARVNGPSVRSGAVLTKSVPASVASSIASRRRTEMQQDTFATRAIMANTPYPPNTLVLLVEFSDVKFQTPSSVLDAKLNSDNYTSGGNTGSVKQYYRDNSMGQYVPAFNVVGPITLNKPESFYGGNDSNGDDKNVRTMVVEACEIANSQVNFAQYDYDGDGFVDNLYIFYAGYSEASGAPANTIWPHQWAITTNPASPILDGVRVLTYACSSELSGSSGNVVEGIGAFCHEFGHTLGLMDFYNTENGEALTLRYLSLMDMGNYLNDSRTPPYLNAEEREMLGWMTIEGIGNGEKSLVSIDKNKAYRIDTANPGEYFLVEARNSATVWDSYLGYPGGLLIYHVDKSGNMVNGKTAADRWKNNTINTYTPHQCMHLVAAAAGDYGSLQYRGVPFFPGSSGMTAFTSTTNPGMVAWSGLAVGVNLMNISYDELDGIASFLVVNALEEDVVLGSVSVGQKDAYISWTTASSEISQWMVEWKKSTETDYSSQVSENKYFRFEGLTPNTEYNIRIASVIAPQEYGNYATTSFKTSATTAIFPAIGLSKSQFIVGESLVLRAINLPDSVSGIVWKLDGVIQNERITFLASGSYSLSCEITYTKNNTATTEIITRKLTVTQ